MKGSHEAGSATLHKRMFAFCSMLGTLSVLGIDPVTGVALSLIATQYLSSL